MGNANNTTLIMTDINKAWWILPRREHAYGPPASQGCPTRDYDSQHGDEMNRISIPYPQHVAIQASPDYPCTSRHFRDIGAVTPCSSGPWWSCIYALDWQFGRDVG